MMKANTATAPGMICIHSESVSRPPAMMMARNMLTTPMMQLPMRKSLSSGATALDYTGSR